MSPFTQGPLAHTNRSVRPISLRLAQVATAKQVNLLDLIGSDTELRRVAETNSGEYAGPCPFCGGADRFRVLPGGGRWYCRQCTPRGGDAIDYVMRRDGVGFREGVVRLASGGFSFLKGLGQPVRAVPPTLEPPSASWQTDMRQHAADCEARLSRPVGRRARDWLHARGLTDDTIRRAALGYSDGRHAGIPSGVVIPCQAHGDLWSIKVRRLEGTPKYQLVRGSRLGALYLADWLTNKPLVVICEGEFDALLLWQEGNDLCDVLTLGSATAHVGKRFLPCFSAGAMYGIATDNDDQGAHAALYWQDLLGPRAVRMPPPAGAKDVTDAWLAGSDLHKWVTESLLQSHHPTRPSPMLPISRNSDQFRGGVGRA